MYNSEAPAWKAIVIHPITASTSKSRVPHLQLEEAQGLTLALGLEIVHSSVISIRQIRPSIFFGAGKLEDLDALAEETEAQILVINDEISPIQQRNIEKRLGLKVIDRTGLILEIFSLRARTKEGKLQVELARLSYEKSRLVRTWTHLERQRGGTGKTGGPGERQIELDRRLIADRIVKLKRELEEVRRTRGLQRAGRERMPFPIVALVGYTNAGKSTLFNNATKAKVLAKDMLFATLDTTSRAMKTPQGRDIILSDTVGFITDLPHELIAAFRATLEEGAEADILIHVRDISGAETEAQKHDVDQILETILKGAEPLPTIIEAWNKADLLPEAALLEAKANRNILFKRDGKVAVLTNSESGEGLNELFDEIDKELSFGAKQKSIICGANDGKMRAWLYDKGVVLREIRNEDGEVVLKVSLDKINEIKFKSQFPEAIESGIVA